MYFFRMFTVSPIFYEIIFLVSCRPFQRNRAFTPFYDECWGSLPFVFSPSHVVFKEEVYPFFFLPTYVTFGCLFGSLGHFSSFEGFP